MEQSSPEKDFTLQKGMQGTTVQMKAWIQEDGDSNINAVVLKNLLQKPLCSNGHNREL